MSSINASVLPSQYHSILVEAKTERTQSVVLVFRSDEAEDDDGHFVTVKVGRELV